MKFRNEYAFLSNMYSRPVCLHGVTYKCAESAFQAQKCLNPEDRTLFADLDGPAAKHLGRRVKLRPDWNAIRLSAMRDVVDAKFADPYLAKRLVQTGSLPIVEENTWHDTFWGVCNGTGENHMGRILEAKRSELQRKENQ